MKSYIRYEIQTRLYSSNIVVGVYLVWNERRKVHEEHIDKLIIPVSKKEEGDKYANDICAFLNEKNYHGAILINEPEPSSLSKDITDMYTYTLNKRRAQYGYPPIPNNSI